MVRPCNARSHAMASSELGNGDFAVTFNARTGRPLRKARWTQENSPFVDSAIALSDPVEDDAVDSDALDEPTISVARRRKRKRSPSPPLSEDTVIDEPLSDFGKVTTHETTPTCQSAVQITFNNLVINVPRGHTGPLLLQLDVPSQLPSNSTIKRSTPRPVQSDESRAFDQKSQINGVKSASKDPSYAGFLDIPAEIRNQIYQHVFVADDHFNFDSPSNFSRGAALLRTCRQIYDEGRSILYSENHFLFVRKTRRHGSYWEREWNEVSILMGIILLLISIKGDAIARTALKLIKFDYARDTFCRVETVL